MKLFVYGSLKKDKPLHNWVEKHLLTQPRRGSISGDLRQLGGVFYPHLFLGGDAEKRVVYGELLEFADTSILDSLDRVEAEYSRGQVGVTLEDGSTVLAWVYYISGDTCIVKGEKITEWEYNEDWASGEKESIEYKEKYISSNTRANYYDDFNYDYAYSEDEKTIGFSYYRKNNFIYTMELAKSFGQYYLEVAKFQKWEDYRDGRGLILEHELDLETLIELRHACDAAIADIENQEFEKAYQRRIAVK